MKLKIILILLLISNFAIAQKDNNQFVIKIKGLPPFIGRQYWFDISKTNDSVRIVYSILDSIQPQLFKKDPEYIKLRDEESKFNDSTNANFRYNTITRKSEIIDKYSAYDRDTVYIPLQNYPDYKKLLNIIYTGTAFNDAKNRPMILDGISFEIKVKSATTDKIFYANNPSKDSNPIINDLINHTYTIYHALSKHPLVFHHIRFKKS